ncbi:hypothetical protein BH11BAC4_BH11BAC4_19460 [soil metagenome]
MKNIIAMMLLALFTLQATAQEQEMKTVPDRPSQQRQEEKETSSGGLDHLFVGGGIQLSFSNYNFGAGASPVIGYSINKWFDIGIGINFTYISQREAYVDAYGNEYATGNKIHQTDIGPIAFARFYPLKFLFVQAQGEQNFITQKYIYGNSAPSEKARFDATSLLLGAGYCSGRQGVGDLFYYVSLSVDVLKNRYSPYVQRAGNGDVNILPILKAGLQVPLFQRRGRR